MPRLPVLGLAIVLALAGCRAAGPGTGSPSDLGQERAATAQPTPAPTPTPTPEPTPTPDEALHAYLTERDGLLVATFTGSHRVGDEVRELSGFHYTEGSNFWFATETIPSSGPQPVERIQHDGQGFERQGEERWYATENITIDGSLATLIDGVTWTDGGRPGWLAPADGDGLDLEALASAIGALPAQLTIEDAQTVKGEVAIEIGPGGQLLGMEVTLRITDRLVTGAEPEKWSFDLIFDPEGESVVIHRPEEAWRQDVLGIMAIVEVPFEFEAQGLDDYPGDMYFGPHGKEIGFSVYETYGLSAVENYQAYVDLLASDDGLGVPMEVDESIVFDGDLSILFVGDDGEVAEAEPAEGRLVAAHVNEEERRLYYIAAMLQRDDAVYFIHWFGSADGTEADQLDLFREIVSTFVPLQ